MSDQTVLRSPQVVAQELDISPATLRRWSDEFIHHLSPEAGAAKGRHRRYSDSDMATLTFIKELLNTGMTYEQVRQKLNGHTADEALSSDKPDSGLQSPDGVEEEDSSLVTRLEEIKSLVDDYDDSAEERALIAHDSDESAAIAFLTNTLATLSDSQKSILNSQAANRELLGVLLQDNFNLKEENNRLRERILEVERDIAQTRRDEEWRREALRQELEAKITASSQLAMEAISTARTIESPDIRTVENKSGCLGMLLGKGGTQIVTVPRRRKAEGQRGRQSPSSSVSRQQPSAQQQQPPQPNHPKPMYPPE